MNARLTIAPARRLATGLLLAVLMLMVIPAGQAGVPEAVSAARAHRAANELRILGEFRELLSMPNVSARLADMTVNAQWIARYLSQRQFSSEIVSAGGAPYLIAERAAPGAQTTLLIYAHFDGQPVDRHEWASDPFVPLIRSEALEAGGQVVGWNDLTAPVNGAWRVFARSAGDDKAPIIALAAALDALDAAGIAPSVNLKLILDGEEEAGSPTLAAILEAHGARLDADLMLFCDGPMHQSRQRQLVFGVRGSMTVELTAYGANRPLHSGHYGNWAPNPTDRLVSLLASLKDGEGRIRVQGYFDAVRPPTAAELAAIAAMPPVDERLQAELALPAREGGEERIERLVLEPAIVIKGLQAGGVGEQSANVIRPTARASLNLRLVPDQTPEEALGHLLRHFQNQGAHVVRQPPGAEILARHSNVLLVEAPGGYPGFRTPLDGVEARRLVALLDAIDDRQTLLTPTMGGSLPIYLFEQALDMPIVLLPIANHDNNQHGANENLRIRNLWDAIDIYAAVIAGYGDMQ
jgi:acetylornithine deacetylase/succinyl-diaminopimelate desuccinylase-like protein